MIATTKKPRNAKRSPPNTAGFTAKANVTFDLPTAQKLLAESGFPGFEAVTWYSVVAPARTPRDAIERLNGEILQALGAAQVKERLSVLGFEIVGSPPDVLAAYIKSEIVKWAPVVKASGAKVD